MRIFGLGMPELIVILIVILLIFGPKNLPKLGNALGRTVKNLREGMGKKKEDTVTDADEVVVEEVQPAGDTVTAAETVEETVTDGPKKKVVRKVVRKKASGE